MLTLAKIDHRLRPLLARVLPPSLFMKSYSVGRNWYMAKLAKAKFDPIEGQFHPTELLGMSFRNDLGNAAGLDKDGLLLDFNYNLGAGFAIVGTVLNQTHTGNLISAFGRKCNPWTPLPFNDSALNSLGLPSKGIGPTIDNIKSFQDRRQPKDFPIGLSIMGHPLQEGKEKLDGVLECVKKSLGTVDFIEINESCPNVKHHDNDSDALKERLNAIMDCRGSEKCPIFVKMGTLGDIAATLKLLSDCGVDGLVGLNTQTDYPKYQETMANGDKKLFNYYTSEHNGGLSGQLIKQHAAGELKKAADFIKAESLALKLIHVGGISDNGDIKASREFADLREWYTCFMTALATQKSSEIYKNMTA